MWYSHAPVDHEITPQKINCTVAKKSPAWLLGLNIIIPQRIIYISVLQEKATYIVIPLAPSEKSFLNCYWHYWPHAQSDLIVGTLPTWNYITLGVFWGVWLVSCACVCEGVCGGRMVGHTVVAVISGQPWSHLFFIQELRRRVLPVVGLLSTSQDLDVSWDTLKLHQLCYIALLWIHFCGSRWLDFVNVVIVIIIIMVAFIPTQPSPSLSPSWAGLLGKSAVQIVREREKKQVGKCSEVAP